MIIEQLKIFRKELTDDYEKATNRLTTDYNLESAVISRLIERFKHEPKLIKEGTNNNDNKTTSSSSS